MDFVPRDVLELIGRELCPKDLAALVVSNKELHDTLEDVMLKKRDAYMMTIRTGIRRAFGSLRCQMLRAMIGYLNDREHFEEGEFPPFELCAFAGLGLSISLADSPWTDFDDDGYGELSMRTTAVGHLDIAVKVRYGTTWTYDTHPIPCWLGVGLHTVMITSSTTGMHVGTWEGPEWYFRDSMPYPTFDPECVEFTDGNMYVADVDGLHMPVPGTDVSFAWCGDSSTRTDTDIIHEALTTLDTDVVSQALRAWEASACVLLKRYRSRANNPEWVHTSYAVDIPEWMDEPFPISKITTAFVGQLDDMWTETAGEAGVISATRSWRHGLLTLTYDIRNETRTMEYIGGGGDAIVEFGAPISGVIAKVLHRSEDVDELIDLFKDAGMPVFTFYM